MLDLGGVYTGTQIVEAIFASFPGPEKRALENVVDSLVYIDPFVKKRCGFLWHKREWKPDTQRRKYIIYVSRGDHALAALKIGSLANIQRRANPPSIFGESDLPEEMKRVLLARLQKIGVPQK